MQEAKVSLLACGGDGKDDISTTTIQRNMSLLTSQILAGITVSLAMVPESLSFTFVAGVSPIVGLHARRSHGFNVRHF